MFKKAEVFKKERRLTEVICEELRKALLIKKTGTIDYLIGEFEKLKNYIDGFFPLSEEGKEKFFTRIKAIYTCDTNKIDGNSLDYNSVFSIVGEDKVSKYGTMKEHIEIVNHMEALDYMEGILKRGIDIDEMKLKLIHNLILRTVDTRHAGIYRQTNISIVGSTYSPPEPKSIPVVMKKFFEFYEENKNKQIHPLVFGAIMHEKLAIIHPFVDGTGIVARLFMNFILRKSGYYMISITGDRENKINYYEALERINEIGDDEVFIKFIVVEGINSYFEYVSILLQMFKNIEGSLYNVLNGTVYQQKIMGMLKASI